MSVHFPLAEMAKKEGFDAWCNLCESWLTIGQWKILGPADQVERFLKDHLEAVHKVTSNRIVITNLELVSRESKGKQP